jgi:GNAT superfamily N-acetyltransferase
MFSVPAHEKLSVELKGELPIEAKPWNIGLILGPSGCGKTLTLEALFGKPIELRWEHGSIIDDFDSALSMDQITETCQAVGFNTIPAWSRPFSVLSNGERFRAELARRLLSNGTPIVIDEFTSVVDRQVAKIASFAVGKVVRNRNRTLVAASCHYDILDWLQPDWIYEPALGLFQWRELRGRPPIEVSISRVEYEKWKLFAPFHYMSEELNHAARCFALYVHNNICSFVGILFRPHPKVRDVVGVSRVVTLPDWQGLGLAMALVDTVGAAYKGKGMRLHQYPNHPAMVRSYIRSKNWLPVKTHGDFSPRRGSTSTIGGFGGKACAVFEYCGPSLPRDVSERLIEGR